MNTAFALDHRPLASAARFKELSHALVGFSSLNSPGEFNAFCHAAIRAWPAHLPARLGEVTPLFAELLGRIERKEEKTITTNWGGVVITRHEPPRVEKFLVVRRGGYLALEKHELKDEHLEAREGAGLVLFRSAPDAPLAVQALSPGDRFHFEPGREHCLIGTENLLVFESGVDPKGMDQDLIFLFEPDGAA